jgi:hypothetical protein
MVFLCLGVNLRPYIGRARSRPFIERRGGILVSERTELTVDRNANDAQQLASIKHK